MVNTAVPSGRPETPKNIFERSLPYYMNSANEYHPNGQGYFTEYKDPFYEVREHYKTKAAKQPRPPTTAPLPYYLFRRCSTDPNQIKVNKKPLYIHTSEITLF